MFNVSTLLAVFAFLVKQLLATADRHEREVQTIQDSIDDLAAAKRGKLAELGRARGAAEKISALIS